MEITKAKKQSHRHVLIFIIAVLLLAAVIVCLFLSGYLGLWVYGMSSIADNKRYEYFHNEVEGEYSFTVDLTHLESNTGKVVFRDGNCYIDIQSMDENDGLYRIHFRSHGVYNIHGATLISGASHPSRSYNVDALLYCCLNDQIYSCHIAGLTGVSFKDGDSFSYYIPTEAMQDGSTTVTLTFSGLVNNKWHKK